jgi:AcrR family transcriptional regulator
MDRRIEKTQTALQLAIRTLMCRYSWRQINVQLLCQEAAISRSTFYAHYESKTDLLDSVFQQFETGLWGIVSDRNLAARGEFIFLTGLVEHVHSNHQLFARNNSMMEGYEVVLRFRKMIENLVHRELDKTSVQTITEPSATAFISAGIYASIVAWASAQCKLPMQDLIEEIDTIVNSLLMTVTPDYRHLSEPPATTSRASEAK